MSEKETTLKQLQSKQKKYRNRRKWLSIALVVQFFIWWILNPGFIPVLTNAVTWVQEFFSGLFWPQDPAEFVSGSYRYYIYEVCQFITDLVLYPLLEWAAPRVVPVWLLITLLQLWYIKLRIKGLNKPPKPKKTPKKKKEKAQFFPGAELLAGAKISGMYPKNCDDARQQLKKLQDSCNDPFVKDRGIWVSNMAIGEGGKAPADVIYPWREDGSIEIKGRDTLRFELYHGVAHLIACDRKLPMRKGVPLTVTHKNEAGREIVDLTATWLGGIV